MSPEIPRVTYIRAYVYMHTSREQFALVSGLYKHIKRPAGEKEKERGGGSEKERRRRFVTSVVCKKKK